MYASQKSTNTDLKPKSVYVTAQYSGAQWYHIRWKMVNEVSHVYRLPSLCYCVNLETKRVLVACCFLEILLLLNM